MSTEVSFKTRICSFKLTNSFVAFRPIYNSIISNLEAYCYVNGLKFTKFDHGFIIKSCSFIIEGKDTLENAVNIKRELEDYFSQIVS